MSNYQVLFSGLKVQEFTHLDVLDSQKNRKMKLHKALMKVIHRVARTFHRVEF
jgi:hypothetical protein